MSLVRQFQIYKVVVHTKLQSDLIKMPWYKPTLTVREKDKIFGAFLRERLVELGPTFIKLGQFASSRSDMFSADIIEELSTLQDSVPPMEKENIDHVLTASGIDIAMFRSFEYVPIAAASLGQAHIASLENGTQVVVKVQRRGLKETIEMDMRILRNVAALFEKLDDTSGHNVIEICDENLKLLRQEIDYNEEGRNACLFRQMYFGKKGVEIPRVIWKYTSDRVITTEYIPGVKINDVKGLRDKGIDASKLAYRLMRSYLYQVVEHGYFHADPHPGNIAVKDDSTIVYYDFGMMGELPSTTNKSLAKFLVAFYTNDYETLYKEMNRMNMLAPSADLVTVMGAVSIFKEYLSSGSISMSDDLLALAIDKPLRLPVEFAFVLRAFTITEGVCKKIDPTFDVNAVAGPWGQKLMENIDFQAQMKEYGQSVTMFPSRVKHIESFVHSLETGRTKLRVRNPSDELEIMKLQMVQRITLYLLLFQVLDNGGGTLASVGEVALGTLTLFELFQSRMWNKF